MSFADFQERLSRSIKVVGLPQPYDKEEILNNLKNAGTIEDVKLGLNEMVVTYSNSNEKDLSKMYDGCPIGEYTLKLEDPTSFEINTGEAPVHEEKVEEKHYEPEPAAPVVQVEETHHNQHVPEHHEPVQQHVAQEPEKVEEAYKEPVYYKEPEPVREEKVEREVQHHEPAVEKAHHVEPEHKEPAVQHHEVPRHQESKPVYVEKVEPVPVVEKREERKSEVVHTEKKAEPTPAPVTVEKARVSEVPAAHHEGAHARGGESSKDLLRELQNTNLPARAGLPNNDMFNVVTKRSYLLIFTMVWGLQLFLRSVF